MSVRPTGLEAALADRYRIGRELGAGGMATVYLADDRRGDAWSDPVKLADLPVPAAANPVFSPDGRFVLYIEASGAVRFVASSGGGAIRTLFERPDAPAALAAWSTDGRGAYVLTGTRAARQSGMHRDRAARDS